MPIGTITNGEAGSAVRTKLNSVISTVNALGSAANNDTGDFATAAQGALADSATQPGDLGNAAVRNVGTTAGTVAEGDDSRMTNARTPTAHAASHVTGGSDAIQAATASVPGLMTAAQATKLDGIEASADVTDAANVASAGAVMTSGLGTGVATALAINVGSAGAPVVNGGALGTPSSGTLTSCTGLPTAGLVDDAVTLAKMAAGTAGNLITYDASGNPAAVATGTATHVLTSNGAGAAPTFQAAAGGGGGGKVLQMVFANKTDTTSGSGTTLADVMTCSITPTSATSRIVMICSGMASASGYYNCGMALARAGTPILIGDTAGLRKRLGTSFYGPAAGTTAVPFCLTAEDEPATTSATTYSLQMQAEAGTYYLNRSANDTDIAYSARGATSIILLEIAP